MRRLVKFLSYPLQTKLVLLEACVRLSYTSVLLRLMPKSEVARFWTKPCPVHTDRPNTLLMERICEIIPVASHYIPGATCLVQCIVARSMLARAGAASTVKLGVQKAGALQAHAWLEYEGKVLLGGPIEHYTALFSMSPANTKR